MRVNANLYRIDRFLVRRRSGHRVDVDLGRGLSGRFCLFLHRTSWPRLACQALGRSRVLAGVGLGRRYMLILGRRAGVAVVVGVLLGTIAANLLSDRHLRPPSSKAFAMRARRFWWPGCWSAGLVDPSLSATCVVSWAFSLRSGHQFQFRPSAAPRLWPSSILQRHSGSLAHGSCRSRRHRVCRAVDDRARAGAGSARPTRAELIEGHRDCRHTYPHSSAAIGDLTTDQEVVHDTNTICGGFPKTATD